MASRLFMTKTWGFGLPTGPLQFSQAGWREKARQLLQPGDQVLIVGTKGSETHESERGRLLGIMEPTTEPGMSLDFVTARGERDFDKQGNYRWPFGLMNKRAWRLIDRPLLTLDISTRKFNMDSAQGIVLLTTEEAAKVAALQMEEVPLLEPRVAARARVAGFETARKRSSPPPTTTRRGVMHMRSAPAYGMEQALLRNFQTKRHRDNHEVVTGITFDTLQAAWIRLISRSIGTRSLSCPPWKAPVPFPRPRLLQRYVRAQRRLREKRTTLGALSNSL